MFKKLIALFLCILLSVSMLLYAVADEETEEEMLPYVDVGEDYWARPYIEQVTQLGLFYGTGDGTTFSPEISMTRAMFVTVLGRLINIDAEQWPGAAAHRQFSDVMPDAWYAPYVLWAVRNGITSGTGNGDFSPNEDVTREQMAAFVSNLIMNLSYQITSLNETPNLQEFSDTGSIASWALDGVTILRITGILNGIDNGNGTFRYNPKGKASRAECSVVFSKLKQALVPPSEQELIAPTGISIVTPRVNINQHGSVSLYAEVTPVEAFNKSVSWSSSNSAIVDVVGAGATATLKWKSAGKAIITATTCNGLSATVEVTALENSNIAHAGESYNEKCIRIFGSYVADPRLVYQTYNQAAPHMKTIQVKTWDINSSGEKYTRTWSLTVHENIADTVEAIFEDLYALPSKPPVHSLGGFRIDGKSEHTVGLAIDINPDENPYVSPSGSVLVGRFFDPASSEYSFAVGGEVEQVFNKYGFTRGIYWRNGYKDYMHFSYFGT